MKSQYQVLHIRSIFKLIKQSLYDTSIALLLMILQLHIYLRHPKLLVVDIFSFLHYFFHRDAYFLENKEFTYGELSYYSLRQLLSTIGLKKGAHIIDFGSGKGKLCFYGTCLGFKMSGIEINSSFFSFSSTMNKKLFDNAIEFTCTDFCDTPIQKGDTIIISPLCLSEATLKKLHQISSAITVISIGCPFPGLPIQKKRMCLTSWGFSECYIHS